MPRPKKALGVRRKQTRRKKKKKKAEPGSDLKLVQDPQGGYAHEGKLEPDEAARLLSQMSDEERNELLRQKYGVGQTPALVMYGRRLHVLSLMAQGEATYSIVDYCGRAFGMSETQTKYLIHEIREQWKRDIDEQTTFARVEAVTRLKKDLSELRADGRVKNAKDIVRHEKLLAEIEGTLQPIKVSVIDANETTRDALMVILGGMSQDELSEFVHGEPPVQVVETTGY